MSGMASMLEVIRQLSLQTAVFLALIMLAAGLHKLIRRERIRNVVHEFAGVPRAVAPLVVAVVAATELLASVLLWTPWHRAAGGALAALVWGVYLALILRALARGRRDMDCGCTFGATHRPLGAFQVARSLTLICAAVLVGMGSAVGTAAPAASLPVTGYAILAAFALAALYGALDQVMALAPPRSGEWS